MGRVLSIEAKAERGMQLSHFSEVDVLTKATSEFLRGGALVTSAQRAHRRSTKLATAVQ